MSYGVAGKMSDLFYAAVRSDEFREACRQRMLGSVQSEATCSRRSVAMTGVGAGTRSDNQTPATGSYVVRTSGYRMLTQQEGHPLASKSGCVYEHRKVLYERIGPGPHPCHWCSRLLEWGGVKGIISDHLNDDKLDNRSENLVPACNRCNVRRSLGLPIIVMEREVHA